MDLVWPKGFEPLDCLTNHERNTNSAGTAWLVRPNAHAQISQLNAEIAKCEKEIGEVEIYMEAITAAIQEYEEYEEENGEMTEEDYNLCLEEHDQKELERSRIEDRKEALEKERDSLPVLSEWEVWKDREEVTLTSTMKLLRPMAATRTNRTIVLQSGLAVKEEFTWVVFKVISPLAETTAEGHTFLSQNLKKTAAGCRDLLVEANQLIEQHKRFIEAREGDPVQAGLLPLVGAQALRRSHEGLDDEYCVGLVSPYCASGCVEDWVDVIKGSDERWYNADFLLSQLSQLLETVQSLHRMGIAHGNIKPSNVMVSNSGKGLMIGDFMPATQVARVLQHRRSASYAAPELYRAIRKGKSTFDILTLLPAHDIFALGLVFLFLINKEHPPKTLIASKEGHAAYIKRFVATENDELTALIRQCLAWEPTDRPQNQEGFFGRLAAWKLW